jgi:hypothetical protein
MKKIVSITLLFLFSCSDTHQTKDIQSSQDRIKKSKEILPVKQVSLQYDTLVSPEFMRLVQILDSSGFIYDSTRFKKTYGKLYETKSITINSHQFYEATFSQTLPYMHIMICDSTNIEYEREWCKQWTLNINTFKRVNKIIQYFYVDKNYKNPNYKGEKYFTDGIIEEWEFPDSASAKLASEELGRKQEMVYFNSVGFISYNQKYMYVFHARAIRFMYTIKPVFEQFTREINATVTNGSIR